MGCIKVEQYIGTEWIDVTTRCQLVDITKGFALLLDSQPPIYDPKTGSINNSWVKGTFRVSVPDDALQEIKDELIGKRCPA
jgi:hypothetical protein